jgi:hypothetical protein
LFEDLGAKALERARLLRGPSLDVSDADMAKILQGISALEAKQTAVESMFARAAGIN